MEDRDAISSFQGLDTVDREQRVAHAALEMEPGFSPLEHECFPPALRFTVLPWGTFLHSICHPIKIFQPFPSSQPSAASLSLWQMWPMGIGPLPLFQRTLCEAEAMHVTDPPWNLARDRCSTNDEQIDLLSSCSAPSCWSLKGTSASNLYAGCVLREALPGLGKTWTVDSVGFEAQDSKKCQEEQARHTGASAFFL